MREKRLLSVNLQHLDIKSIKQVCKLRFSKVNTKVLAN
jgi:hypothetical protein